MKYNEAKIKECADWVEIHGLMDYGGAMLKDFCEAMDISQELYYQWMEKIEFLEAIRKAKQTFKDSLEKRIVDSLANSALGYEAEEVRSEYSSDLITGKPKLKKQTRTKKHIQPNTGAAIFLLTNITPERWKNKLNTEHSGDVDTRVHFTVESEEDKELINRIRTKPKSEAQDEGISG